MEFANINAHKQNILWILPLIVIFKIIAKLKIVKYVIKIIQKIAWNVKIIMIFQKESVLDVLMDTFKVLPIKGK